MTSLLRMTSLTPETDSKTASSRPSRHLGPIWHFARTEPLTPPVPRPVPDSFLSSSPPVSTALNPGYMSREVTWGHRWGGWGKGPRWPQSFKCERLAGSDRGTTPQGILLFSRSLFSLFSLFSHQTKTFLLILSYTRLSCYQPTKPMFSELSFLLYRVFRPFNSVPLSSLQGS